MIFLLLCTTMAMLAQNTNRLLVQDVKGIKGTSVLLSVQLENTSTDIVGMQWDLNLPNGVTLNTESATLSADRKADHVVAVQNQGGGRYTFLVYSAGGNAIRGNSGTVLTVKASLAEWLEEDKQYPVRLTNVVLTNASGDNLATGSADGTITITHTPDFEISDLQVLTSQVAPNGTIRASWTVTNVGEVASAGGWSERVSLYSASGYEVAVATLPSGVETLGSQAQKSREAEITLSDLPGADGPCALKVEIIPDANAGESNSLRGNNIATSAEDAIFVEKILKLTLPARVSEGKDYSVRGVLTRSGARTKAETYTLTMEGDERLEAPATVTIEANASGASFWMPLNDNDFLDPDSLFTFEASGNGYEATTASFIVEDDELPPLSLKMSKTDLEEGETATLTLFTEKAPVKPLTVSLGDDAPGRMQYAKEITLQAGSNSVTIPVQLIDNDIIESIQVAALYAKAEGYEPAECLVVIHDNDMPTLSFSLSPGIVSEGAGENAIIGVVKRTDQMDKKVTLRLSDNSNGVLSYPSSTIVMEKEMDEAHFSIGINDNSTVDGNHTYTVTATVYATACNCPAQGDEQGTFTQDVTVTDNDGPALSVTTPEKTLLEGSTLTLAVSRNTAGDNSKPATIHIESDKENRLTYEHDITFAAGETRKEVTVTANQNGTSDDDEVVTFIATSEGYANGSMWILITDQNQPDMELGDLTINNTVVEVGSPMHLSLEVRNAGYAVLPSGIPISILLDGRRKATLHTDRALGMGETLSIAHDMNAPVTTGEHQLQAEANPNHDVRELLYSNNISSNATILVQSNFNVTVSADKERYAQGEEVRINGYVSGSAKANVDLDVYLVNKGTRQTLNAHTDQDGHFSLVWTPMGRQTGHYQLGGCYPGEESNAVMDEFDVVGLYTESGFGSLVVGQTETYEGAIRVFNDGNITQTNIHATMKDAATSGEFTFQTLNKIEAGQWGEIPFTFKGLEISPSKDWETMAVDITSEQGASYSYKLYYYVQPLRGSLSSETKEISTTVTMGSSRDYPITIKNVGKGETGNITFSLPKWIQPVTSSESLSLKSGESAVVILRISTTDEMYLNVPVTGHVSINCSEGNGLAIPIRITPVSEQRGTLTVDVVDEFTFNTAEAPHVANAHVAVLKPYTKDVVAEGTTDANGHFTTSINEGWYEIEVSAYKHANGNGSVLVDPGSEKTLQVFASYQNVTYSWDVEETEVDDEYHVVMSADFDTHVPKAYVTIDYPEERPMPNSIIPVTIENKGLINVKDVRIAGALSDGSELVWLNEPYLDILEPQQPKVFYAKVVAPAAGTNRSISEFASCLGMAIYTHYYQICEAFEYGDYTVSTRDYGHCNDLADLLTDLNEILKRLLKPDDDRPPFLPPSEPPVTEDDPIIIIEPPIPPTNPKSFCDYILPKKNDAPSKGAKAAKVEEEPQSVCSTITLAFDQTTVIARQAFRGTLTVNNGHEEEALKDLKVYLMVKDAEDNVATSHEFQINVEMLEGFTGEKALDAGWTLSGSVTGTATILFIPTPFAAIDSPKEYSFGGSFSYTDPFNGLTVMHDLNPVKLTVNPTPRLDLDYFLQRDVISDNPLTLDVVEKTELAEFALLINNKGNGDARNMRVFTQQPQIVDNEKGLIIDFNIVSSQLNGEEASLTFGENIATSVGDIPAHGQAYLQWWLKSSLMGHFKNYEVEANHVTSYDNPDLSLLDTVRIHELIRGVRVPGSNTRAFVVNDIYDTDFYPDMAYLTDGTVAEVQPAKSISVTRISDSEYKLIVSAADSGWVYGRVADPTGGSMNLCGIIRNSDGLETDLSNIWQTYVTLREGKDPFYENLIHVADLLENTYESYTLYFEPKPETDLRVATFIGTPESGETEDKVRNVTVAFTKDVDNSTFTKDDIVLTLEGVRLNNGLINISQVDEATYVLDLSSLTSSYGYYVLSVNAKDVRDTDGFWGVANSSVAWLQYDPDMVREMPTAHWQVSVSENTIVISSDTDMTLPILTVDGRLCRKLHVTKGISYHQGLAPGVYILGDKKLVVSH